MGGSACQGATRPKSALDGKAADHQLLPMVEGGGHGDLGEDTHVSSSGQQLRPHLAPQGLFLQLQGLDRKLRLLLP